MKNNATFKIQIFYDQEILIGEETKLLKISWFK